MTTEKIYEARLTFLFRNEAGEMREESHTIQYIADSSKHAVGEAVRWATNRQETFRRLDEESPNPTSEPQRSPRYGFGPLGSVKVFRMYFQRVDDTGYLSIDKGQVFEWKCDIGYPIPTHEQIANNFCPRIYEPKESN